MATLFFYGTLRHIPLLEIVLGRALGPNDVIDATLHGHQAMAVVGHDFPSLITAPGAAATGIVLPDLSETDVARLDFYEGGFHYTLQEITAQTAQGAMQAKVYFAAPDKWQADGLWDLTAWQNKHGLRTCFTAEEAMSYFGQISPETLDMRFPMIRVRGAAKANAKARNAALSPSGFTRADAEPQGVSRPFTHFFAMETHHVAFRQYDGQMSAPVDREVFAASDASIVLPYDPLRDRVLLIEQFRPGPYARADEKPWMIEPIAGRVDPGETPEETAHREAREEAGLTLNKLHSVARCYASPGCSTEYFNIFVGEADLPDDVTGIAGLDVEAEDIKSYLYTFDELMEMVDSFQAANAPLVLAALWLARSRDRLRATA